MPRPPRSPTRAALAVGGGVLVALALPPWGFWPLAFVGIVLFELSLGSQPTRRQRLARAALFAAAWFVPGLMWMWFLTPPGYIIAAATFAGYHTIAAWIAPRGPWRVIGRPAAHTLAEALRFSFPFGGVPLASLPIAQASGPFLPLARLGGAVLLTWFVFQLGFAAGALATSAGNRRRAFEWTAVAGLVAALVLVPLAAIAPDGAGGGAHRSLRVTVVQGGGPQGTHAVAGRSDDSALVFQRHLTASRSIAAGSTDLVVWPENVISVTRFLGSDELREVTAEAKRIGAPFVVGITEDDGPDHFLNAEVVVATDGTVTSRYDKVRRVPFGEYMPLRGLLHALGAPTNLVPRDAVAGHGPAVLDLPDGTRLAVVISWEVFFGGRANEGVEHGGTLLINPTNGSSYTWTILQSQQIAASRLRAVEQGRWLAQAAPTGFSTFVTPSGHLIDRTGVSEQKVLSHVIVERTGRTWYSRLGNKPITVAIVLILLGAWLVPGRAWWRTRRRHEGAVPAPTAELASEP
jgi:apolipoprotein N-acyltransferase